MSPVPTAIDLRELLQIREDTAPSATPYTANARYQSSLEGFNIKRPPVPAHVFLAERDQALAPSCPTSLIPLDLEDRLEVGGPATTPLVLARYAVIRPDETLGTTFRASAELCYVMRGSGHTTFGAGEPLTWARGDVFCLPGGGQSVHAAGPEGAVLWVVTNEPQLAFERLEPPLAGAAPIAVAHYPAARIRHELLRIHTDPRAETMTGKAVTFGNAKLEGRHTITPSFTLAMNSLVPGEVQRAHRHNAAAVTLVVAGEGCYSLIEGQKVDWEADAVMITPPAELHSHHNEGGRMALFLIVQDGGLHYHCRTMGFSFE